VRASRLLACLLTFAQQSARPCHSANCLPVLAAVRVTTGHEIARDSGRKPALASGPKLPLAVELNTPAQSCDEGLPLGAAPATPAETANSAPVANAAATNFFTLEPQTS
jgi:hypothetical protein